MEPDDTIDDILRETVELWSRPSDRAAEERRQVRLACPRLAQLLDDLADEWAV